jgi:predicted Zn-dependent protease
VIGPVLDALAGRVTSADTVVKTDDVLSVVISADGDTRVSTARSRMSHLRVAREGRIGFASGSGDDVAELVGRAMASAAAGEELELWLPAPAPLPEVVTRAPQAAAADVAALGSLARTLRDRLVRSNRRVEVWAERSFGSVQLASSRAVLAGYDATLSGIGAVVESIGVGWAPPCRVHCASAELPTLFEVEELVADVDRRLAPPIVEHPVPLPAAMPVCFAPRAVRTLLRPLRAALTGQEAFLGRSPLRARLGERMFDEKLSLLDDALAPGRPGSRPIDDDGVVSRLVPLIERGRLMNFVADLQVGVRAGVPSTGHAWRLPSAAPRVGFTNLRLTPGLENRATLLTMMGTGLLVEDLDWEAGTNSLAGTIALNAPWAYLVEGGRIRGRLEGVVLSGNVYEALGRISAVGSDATWLGAHSLPSLLLEGLGVGLRA